LYECVLGLFSPAAAADTTNADNTAVNGGDVEPWLMATLVVLTAAAIVFVVVVFALCLRRRRDHFKSARCRNAAGTVTVIC